MRAPSVLIATALIAAACGGGGSSPTLESLDSAASNTLTLTDPDSTPVPTSRPTTSLAPSRATSTHAPAPPVPADLPDSDYPDVVMVDLAGGEVNLRELALERKPVLLWFWAPH